MIIVTPSAINLFVEREVKVVIEGQRALTAFLATGFETQ